MQRFFFNGSQSHDFDCKVPVLLTNYDRKQLVLVSETPEVMELKLRSY